MPNSGAEVLPARLALDTSAYAHLRHGESRVIGVVAEAEVVYISATVLGELEAGFRVGTRYRENQHALAELLREPYVEIRDTTADVARRYGEVFAALRSAGTPIPVNDIWIAAATIDVGAHLITFDKDFSKVEGLSHTLFVAS
jgi:predicted nucleic acid-binding protein